MSMIGNFLQISPQQLDELLADPASVVQLLYPDDEFNEDIVDIDKAWQAIHFVLAGDPWAGEPPLANCVMGGAEVGDEDVGYGPARYITKAEVGAVAKELAGIDKAGLRLRLDRAELEANDIYPGNWDEEENFEYVTQWYETLRAYYLDAAQRGNAMLKFLN